jgi:hypothetical protein
MAAKSQLKLSVPSNTHNGMCSYISRKQLTSFSANPGLLELLDYDNNDVSEDLDFMLKTITRWCIQSLGGVRMTNSEGLWPELVCCAPHLSMVPLISDKVQ